MRAFVHLLLETGLLQFGRFQQDAGFVPFRSGFEQLPAYPDVLKMTAREIAGLINISPDRILVPAEALPLGVAVSLHSDIPLVYSRGQGESPAHDLVGAYNSGHTTVVLLNFLETWNSIDLLRQNVQHVGLILRAVIALVDLGVDHVRSDVPFYPLLRLPTVVDDLSAQQYLSKGQAEAIHQWITERGQQLITPHPVSGEP